MFRPNPPQDFSTDQRILLYYSFYAEYHQSGVDETHVRMKTAAVCSLLFTFITFGLSLGIWGAATQHLSSLNLTLTITGTVVFVIVGVALTTLIGLRSDAPAYRLEEERKTLNERLSLTIAKDQQ